MKILAFDQASFKTGVALFEDTVLNGYTVLDYSKEKNTTERLRLMVLGIVKILIDEKPDVVILEDVALQRNAAALIILARIQGAVLGHCFEHGITNVIYKPSTWRKMLNFKQDNKVRRAQLKQQAIDFVKEHYDLDVGEDEADAICIGCAFACSLLNEKAG